MGTQRTTPWVELWCMKSMKIGLNFSRLCWPWPFQIVMPVMYQKPKRNHKNRGLYLLIICCSL